MSECTYRVQLGNPQAQPQAGSGNKWVPCEAFRRHQCGFTADACRFSHDAEILQTKRRNLCKRLLKKKGCQKKTCEWSHDIGAHPCLSYIFFDECEKEENGERCPFSHEKPAEEREKIQFIHWYSYKLHQHMKGADKGEDEALKKKKRELLEKRWWYPIFIKEGRSCRSKEKLVAGMRSSTSRLEKLE
uniref:C3H1-type domain-containing protein n=1 Tax=Chromera velia CCMP2878 TaxID=1169474 RepID=A0A0G4HRF5_9ALVE|mmetsp:Transcript_23952/g.47042  ORF Transcript_23952/g.47042 Transcript_23952/m.47042 type:complete len:188 (-) Transcript_23952:225-788(-)|eukprot:Cvel_8090.t1-p1 / transcript=Cvel_8090.t1 / gene=Cvel_8090 / organism=Chromera_velia_CCMP2878 / gene_product=hypothetical protein / transcript_product=hypothetical protein / location=Cvel_scaffold439:36518-37791(-) / protein_length=187 / sequence_SO=supercontig / SO=protein_coding / is_pseudo=false